MKNLTGLKRFVFRVFIVLSVFVFFSCEDKSFSKEDEEIKDTKGNLRVTVFKIEKTPFENAVSANYILSSPASGVCERLNFAIYDQEGVKIKQVNQVREQAGFGNVSFQLDEGTYRLVVVAHSANGNPTMTDLSKIQFTNTTGYTDTFLYSEDIVIGEEPLDLQVSLERVVSLCRFVITDDYPSDVRQMRFYYTGGSGAFNAITGMGSVNSRQILTFDVTSGEKQFDIYTFLHEQEGNISLKVSALDVNGDMLYEREFDVPMQQNHITWLTGTYFANNPLSSINSIDIDTNWTGETHITF